MKKKRRFGKLNPGRPGKPVTAEDKVWLLAALATSRMPARVVVPRHLRDLRDQLLRMRGLGYDVLGENDGTIQWTTSNRLDINNYGARGSGTIPHIGLVKKRKG